jgi:arginyl-tRNA synthetase
MLKMQKIVIQRTVMNIFKTYHSKIVEIVKAFAPEISEQTIQNITAEAPRDSSHGDIATNAAMVLAKPLGKNPREIANLIVEQLKNDATIEGAEVAGAGFINLKLKTSVWLDFLNKVITDSKITPSNIANGEKINIEYVSANPTGPMHIGHARNSVIGDVLARLYAAVGYNVTKEYYINDAGAQVNVLASSAFLRYKEALGVDIGEIPAGLYPGEYLKDVGKKIAKEFGDKFLNYVGAEGSETPAEIKPFVIAEILQMIKADLAALGVKHDVFTSEAAIVASGKIQESIEFLQAEGNIYRGVLEPPKGKTPDDWEPREQTLFRATNFGDDVDRPLQKSNGDYTYFATDIAYHKDKIDRGFNKMVITLGADHGGYVKRLQAVVKSLSGGQAEIKVIVSQLVNLLENGEQVRMSKRAGNFVTMRDVLDEVGAQALRFIMLTRKAEAVIDFDLQKVKEQNKDNPVFYVQYAHARICSVLRQAEEVFGAVNLKQNIKFELLQHTAELNLIKKIAEFPRAIELAAIHAEPHRVALYAHELASDFHSLWALGRDANLKFIDAENIEVSKARLALITGCKIAIAAALDVVGVEAVEKM